MNNRDKYLDALSKSSIEQGYYLALFTDAVKIGDYNRSDMELIISDEEFDNKLLDMRVFDINQELRIYRSDISRKYHIRLLSDGEFFEDYHIIDNNHFEILNNKKRIKVANYLGYDKYGQAYIKDWRIVDFEEEC